MNHFHTKTKSEVMKELETSEKGLTSHEAQERLEKFGHNRITKKKKTPRILIFLNQFRSNLIYILVVAMVISFVFDHFVDGYVILAVIMINAVIGFVQERKAERAIDALKKLIVSYAKVLRNEDEIKISAEDVVPGDIILLEEGDKVPADARIIELKNFRTQESSLTGESIPVEKKLGVIDSEVSIEDQTNMVFQVTLVVSGYAKALVVATGSHTEIGKVAKSIQEIVQPKMHFNEKISQLSFQMALFAGIGASLIFLVGFFINKLNFFEIFLFTIASLVSAIPEGLPAVLIIVLTVGARRMARRKALIRHLPAVETLGVATIIAADKTGTITKNTMDVEEIRTINKNFEVSGNGWEPIGRFSENKKHLNPLKIPELKKTLEISALCNKSNLLRKDGDYEITGDPTEAALVVLAKKASIDREKLSETQKVEDDLPFSSELKFRASIVKFKDSKKKEVYSVGAFETIIKNSSYAIKSGKKIKLGEKEKKELSKNASEMAKKGMRVLALAYKDIPHYTKSCSKDYINNLVFVSLVGMKDPPRPEVSQAVRKARNAGIRVIMKTGDHKETAIAIAKEVGIYTGKEKVLTGQELEKMNDSELSKAVGEVDIFARVTPAMKSRIVKALQEKGEIVAMTGDGVNDAPALKRADIGISMGIIGTDVARESSELVLADDNFATIVNAVEEGRIVFQNVRQTSFYLITTNVAEHATILVSLFMKMPLPLLPIQVLYLNLVTDTFNGMALAVEPGHHDVLNQPPRNRKEKIIDKELWVFLVIMASLMVVGTIPLFYYFLNESVDKARTIAFVSMSMFQLMNVFNMRSLHKSIFKIGVFSNKWISLAIASSFALMLAVIYIPLLAGIFDFIPLTLMEFMFITLISSSVLIFGEIYKKFFPRKGIK